MRSVIENFSIRSIAGDPVFEINSKLDLQFCELLVDFLVENIIFEGFVKNYLTVYYALQGKGQTYCFIIQANSSRGLGIFVDRFPDDVSRQKIQNIINELDLDWCI